MRALKILTWHTHGSYLYYLTQAPHEFYVLSKPGRPPGYTGRWGHLPWGPNVHDLPVECAAGQPLDCIVFQDDHQYLHDQHEYLTEAQRRLPRIYLEHDPPCRHPTDSRHPVDDPDMLLVHVTPYNQLMWDSGRTPTRVIEHGVIAPERVRYRGDVPRGLVIVNHLARRGRRLGADVFEYVRTRVPLDLIGMGAQESGGLGEIRHAELSQFAAQYRFLFNPIRYTSLGLAVIEAMMVGMPVVALATTEMARVVQNGVNGYADTRVDTLIEHMNRLLSDPEHAQRLGRSARAYAMRRFSIERFVRDWDVAFTSMARL
ncbi:MAG: glycosyltransferase family 4 protein [Burkholderiales bacterium]|nr:glycosyltransferase family 4 protein [Burkholderiales bacterium]